MANNVNNKYKKLKLQYSYGPGDAWKDVMPPRYKAGDLIEENSPDCGGANKIYRWYALPNEFICDGYNKYYKEVYQVSTDGGLTWENVTPLQTRTGQLKEANSIDCGYGITWEPVPDEYICEKTTVKHYNRYQKLQKYHLGQPVEPASYKKGQLIKTGEWNTIEECEGYCPTEYKETVLDTISKYGITYTLNIKEKSDNCGNTWQQEGEEYNKFVSYNIVDDDTLTTNTVFSDFNIQNQWWFNGTNYELYFCNEDGIYHVNFELKTITLYQTFASATSSFFQQNQPLLVKRNYYYTNISNNQRYYINNLCFYNFPYYDPVNKKLVYVSQDEDLQTGAKLVIIENDTYNSIDVPGMYDSCTYYYDGYIYYRSSSSYVKINITDYSIETIPLNGNLSLIANNDNLYYFVYPKSFAIGSGRSNNTGDNVVYDYYYLNNYGLKEGYYSYGIEDVINDTLPTFSEKIVTSRLSGTSVLNNNSNLMMRNEPYCMYILMTQMPSGTGLPTKVFINQGNGYFVNYCVTYDSDRYLFLGIKRNVLLYYNTNKYSNNKLMFVTLDIKENEYHNNGNEVCFGSAKYSILENNKGNIIYDHLITTNSSECNPILYEWKQIDPSMKQP